jgi:EpsI family protein
MTRRVAPLLLLLACAALIRWELQPVEALGAGRLDDIPLQLGMWQGRRGADFQTQVVATLGVDDYINRGYYAATGASANLYVGYHRSQKQGTSVHSPLNCLPGAGWQPTLTQVVPFAGGTARRVIVVKGPERLLVMYWYHTASRIEGDEFRGRLTAMLDAVRYRRNDAALVRLIVPIDSDAQGETRAISHLMDLAALIEPHVSRTLFVATLPGSSQSTELR